MIFFHSLSLSFCYMQLIEQSSILERTQEAKEEEENDEDELKTKKFLLIF